MCRNIKTLFNFEPPVTEDEIHAASLQFVRKISGFNKPSKANEAAFHAAVEEIARVSGHLLTSLETGATPKDREVEDAKARIRARQTLRMGTAPVHACSQLPRGSSQYPRPARPLRVLPLVMPLFHRRIYS